MCCERGLAIEQGGALRIIVTTPYLGGGAHFISLPPLPNYPDLSRKVGGREKRNLVDLPKDGRLFATGKQILK